ncbi:PAP2 superfamily protein [Gillisia sp. Hel1_33_143]|uniref:phosphatase PAP2 family protein n=1 Tax=Gillisia sp. Hel1_33_143 TaxID=1336796 RepID=UPI00087C9A31|nr:phosphatase PAP2 family protein [Gillisia sp. Hel1_33_143]SDS76376.1 PAP2 superfamily protein [Gillisia sp. Hel1_33_143]
MHRSNSSLHRIVISVCLISFFTFQLKAQDTSETKPKVGTVQRVGDVFLFVLPAATLGTSLILDDDKGVWQFTKGFVLTEVITFGLKIGINKPRPDQSNDNSFPSGHTSTVFHSAGFIHKRYGFKYAIPSYIIAGYTAASRIDSKKHDILDVLAGAAIGLGSNLLFTTDYEMEHMELTYSNFENSHMIGFKYMF